jgi:hypothetical protein
MLFMLLRVENSVQVSGLFPSSLRPDAKADPVGDVLNMNVSANEMKGLL